MENSKIKVGWYRNLNLRLALAMAAVIIPINILMVVISATIYQHYEDQLLDSYGNQLNIYMEGINKEITDIQKNVMDFLSGENMILLTTDDTTDPVIAMARIKQQIERQRDWTLLPGLYYIQSHERDMIGILQRNKSYGLKQLEQVRAYIEQKEIYENITSETEFPVIEDAVFLLQNYHFKRFSFGVLCDIEDILSDFYDNGGSARGSLYLTAKDGSVLGGIQDGGFMITPEMEGADKQFSGYYTFEREFADTGCHVLWVLEKSAVLEQMPLLISILWVLALLCLAAFPLLYFAAKRMIVRPLLGLTKGMKIVEKGDFKHHLTDQTGSYQIDYIYYMFNHMVDQIQLLITESYQKEIDQLKTDAVNMKLQVNQHLLLNFLNTIYSLSSAGNHQTLNTFTLLLMKYFRYVLRENSDLVTVREEIQFVRDYLEIQQIRFPDYFTSVYSVAEDVQDILIPKLLIENFVENAVKHGANPDCQIEILINVRKEAGRVCISICDTGNGMDADTVDRLNRGDIIEDCVGRHIGVWNCRRRLKLYYGENYRLKVTSREGEGTQVWIELPAEPEGRDEASVKSYELL